MNAEAIWQAAVGELQLQMTKATFDTWIKNTYVISHEDGTFVIGTHSTYAKEWLENRLRPTIKRTLANLSGRTVEVKFLVRQKTPGEDLEPSSLLSGPVELEEPRTNGALRSSTVLNPRYTFDAFIVGSSNRLAHAASLAVAENLANAYNPLFIYGGVGLGKTHLLHAIGHKASKGRHGVLYVSSEEFTNDLIGAIQTHTTEEFRTKYRGSDVLLIDDIQFIAGKESTQEEFFHTFNTLHAADRQIVISSDRPPQAITTLEERLRSRFTWGLIADIQPPDFETRVAILRSKAAQQSTTVPPEVIEFIAQKIQSNIRELEGALNRASAYASLMGLPMTVGTTEKALYGLVGRHRELSSSEIMALVARSYNLEVADLQGRSRSREISHPRQVAMYLIREETAASYPEIGAALGGRDHTTILHGHEKIADAIEEDDQLRRQVLRIKEKLYNQTTSTG